jgi:hypothetical protein
MIRAAGEFSFRYLENSQKGSEVDMKKSYLFLIALLCVALSGVGAQENLNITSINQYYHNWFDGVNDVCVQSGYAYLACGTEGLRIAEISQPGVMTEIGHCPITDSIITSINSVAVSGNFAYLGGDNGGILVIDISNPSTPQTIHAIPLNGTIFSIRISGNYAYCCRYGLTIIDISNPTAAYVVWNSTDTFEIDDIEIHGDTAYAAWGERGLRVLDVSQKSAPRLIATYAFLDGTWVGGVSISGNYAYLAAGSRGFQVIDLVTMRNVAGIDSLYYGFRLKVRDSHVYMTYGDPECPLAIIDISNPTSPQIQGIYYPPQDIVNFALDGDLVYVADYYHGVRVVDTAVPQNPHEEYIYNRYGHDYNVVISGNIGLVQEDYRIVGVDIQYPSDPFEISSFELPMRPRNIELVGSTAFVCVSNNTCLYSIDYSDLSSPELLGSFTCDTDGLYIAAIYDHYAYILGYNGIRIIDISNPAEMTQVDFFQHSTSSGILEIFGHYAVFQDINQNLIFADLSNPTEPSVIGTYSLGLGQCCYYAVESNGRLYVGGNRKFWIFNITDPANPLLLSETTTSDSQYSNVNGIIVKGNLAYLAIGQVGLNVYDITDGAHPEIVGHYQTPGSPCGIEMIGNIAVIADRTNLGFYDCSQITLVSENSPMPQEFTLLPNYPNPFNGSTQIQFEMPKAGHVSILVYDILGRNVGTLADREFDAGKHSLIWNSNDIASGRYYIKASSNGATQSLPVTLLK